LSKNTWTFLLLFVLGVFCSSIVWAATFEISSPKDRLVTREKMVMLRGQASGFKGVKVNGSFIDVNSRGDFSAGIFLSPGKNFIAVEAVPRTGKTKKLDRRILRLISFADIQEIAQKDPRHFSRKPIEELGTLGIVEPYPDGNFYPKKPLTKGELATWITKAKYLKTTVLEDDIAYDAPREHWRSPHIKACLDNGYLQMDDTETFGSNRDVTRAEMVKIALQLMGTAPSGSAKKVFQDVPLVHEAAREVYLAWKSNLVEGVSDYFKLFDPNRYITREEAATLMARLPFIAAQIKALNSFAVGYDSKVFAQIDTPPQIEWFKIVPPRISRSGARPVSLSAKVFDRQGHADIISVRADLSSLGGPPDAEMQDEGVEGDAKKGDAVFTLNFSVSVEATGGYPIRVIALDKRGWQGSMYKNLTVVE
jgi:hypothetical protein